MSEFTIKDSGARQEFSGGMVRDTTEGKISFLNVRFGPMLRRWAEHLTKGRQKYPDPEPGVPNWTLAQGVEEYLRAKDSAARHFEQWLAGDRDEDHAAGVYFNINLAEYVLEKAANNGEEIDPGLGVTSPTLYATPDVPPALADPFEVLDEQAFPRLTALMDNTDPFESPLGWSVRCNSHCLDCICPADGDDPA